MFIIFPSFEYKFFEDKDLWFVHWSQKLEQYLAFHKHLLN